MTLLAPEFRDARCFANFAPQILAAGNDLSEEAIVPLLTGPRGGSRVLIRGANEKKRLIYRRYY